ncbi:MAG: serpin family protein, partial [Actinobacteria bacterium]|nr:serpin family protein [Actinomycetota bacterium]
MASPGGSAARAFDSFGGALLAVLGGGSGNTVFSPVSVGAALLMALLGARGSTAAQLAAALRLASPAEAGDGLQLLPRLPEAPGDELTFRDPYTIWVQAGLPVRPEFSRTLTGLGAAVRDADFSRAPAQARQEINELIGKQTAGKIPNVLGPGSVTAATRMVLASAVYLKAGWEHPFPARATAGGPFYPGPGRTLTVPLMHLTARMRYLRADGYQ